MRKENETKNKPSNVSGITLIALIITIIILIILAGIAIGALLGENGLLRKSEEAKFKSKMSAIEEQWKMYVSESMIQSIGSLDKTQLYAGGDILYDIIADEEIEMDIGLIRDIKKLLSEVTEKEEKYTIGYEGEFYYVSKKTTPNNQQQVEWCKELGIKIWEYKGLSNSKVVNGDYKSVNGVYLCTPKLDTGFVKEKTRYIKEEDGNLVPGNWILKRPDEDWYDYKNQKWANLYVESEGIDSYYVWIPRYVYKIAENERTDVKFVDINNNYTDAETEKVTTWETLQSQGYQIPEAFYYGDEEETQKNTPIPGYWITKYQLSQLNDSSQYKVDFATTATPTTISIKDIKTATDQKIAKYQYALNGKIVHESEEPEEHVLKDLTKGNKAINITLLDEKGQIIGSMTKLYEVADVNVPDLTGFDQDTTFYVYWDENGNEHNEVPINQEPPAEWYDYGIRSWANIVTRNNGLETYLVWIPRYQYALDTVSQRAYVRFIKGIGTDTNEGYQIPEAFTWGDDGKTQLKGYWMTKYQISTGDNPDMIAEMSAGSDTIRVKDIAGAAITGNLKFEYYINGKKVHEGTSKTENYVYTGLDANKTYTINIIARNANTNAYVAAVTKKLETIGGNPPDLTGFNENRTYYVLFDEDGNNMTIGNKIKNDGSNAPDNWYDYSTRKWANIVVTDGNVQNGTVTGATTTTYFVWIPRYQYSLDTTNQRANVKLMSGIGTDTQAGYQIPEAFTWGDNGEVQLPGYWMSKYQISDN